MEPCGLGALQKAFEQLKEMYQDGEIKELYDFAGVEFNEFDLNVFFQAKGSFENAQFTYKDEVQKWLDFDSHKVM